MNQLSLVIKREYINKVRNKSFLIMTVLSPLIAIGLLGVVIYLSQLNNNKERTIAVLDETGTLTSAFEDTKTVSYNILENKNLKEAKAYIKEEKNYGLVYIENKTDLDDIAKHIKFYSEESPSHSVITNLENIISKKLTQSKLKTIGIDVEKIKESTIEVSIIQESFLGKKTSKTDNILKLIFGGAAGYLLFMFIIIYGNMIMRSVIEEKTSRIIEIIISSVKPIQLMMGKIIGTSLAGITQFVIWVILGGVLLTVVSVVFNIDLGQMQAPQQELINTMADTQETAQKAQKFISGFFSLPLLNLCIAFILFFISGYLLYSSLYAAIGAAVDNETDTQQFMLPIIMPLILAVYIGAFTVIEDPHGTVSTVFSFIPFTSPVVMLMRIPFGVPLWQQMLSLLLLIATFMLTVWFAAKIYRTGILMYGKKPTYKDLIKWIKY